VDRSRRTPHRDAVAWLEALIAEVPEIAHRLAAGRRVDRVRGVGPFGRRATRAWANRLVLVGDAADFFDPFTGDGIWAALRGAELVAHAATAPDRLAAYGAARRRAFAGKWIVERMISAAVGRPSLFDHVARRLARRSGLIDTLVGVCGHQRPSRQVLAPGFILRMIS
jgi:flavin-dependent dehydrogenase